MSSIESPVNSLAGRKPRTGCLGCLLKAIWAMFLALVFGVIVVMGLTALLFPWAFYLGGNFHITPYWQGWGKLRAKSGDYVLFIRIEPTTRGSHVYAHSDLKGVAYLCTPRGEHFTLTLGGSMRPYLKLSTDGEPISLYMHYRPWYANFVTTDYRPSLNFRGNWRNPNLVMDDEGSVARAFAPNGSVFRGPGSNPSSPEIVPLALTAGSYSDFKAACAAVRR